MVFPRALARSMCVPFRPVRTPPCSSAARPALRAPSAQNTDGVQGRGRATALASEGVVKELCANACSRMSGNVPCLHPKRG